MEQALVITLWTGVAVGLAGLVLGLWQILSGPDLPNYPTSGHFKRAAMFLFMASLLYRSVETVNGALNGLPDGTVLRTTVGQAVSATMLLVLLTTFLIDHCRNWLPARTHRRIRQLLQIAHCRPSKGLEAARASASVGFAVPPSASVVTPALIELHLQGVHVVGPNEGPDAVTERSR